MEDTLKLLIGALQAVKPSGVDKVEVQQVQVNATLTKIYKEMLVDYMNYRLIESRLIELEAKYSARGKKQTAKSKRHGSMRKDRKQTRKNPKHTP